MDGQLAGKHKLAPKQFAAQAVQSELAEAEHMLRYWWASRYCVGQRILDAGCGLASGAAILARAGAEEVVAIDISEPVLEVARQSMSADVICELGNIGSLEYDSDSFDVVVCFEVLEQLGDRDGALDELARVLRPDGLLLVSLTARDHPVASGADERAAYQPDELGEALRRRFTKVALKQQQAMMASVVVSADGVLDGAELRLLAEPAAGDDAQCTLAMAGAQLPDRGPPLVALTHLLDLRRWLDHSEAQRRALEEQAELLAEGQDLRRITLQALKHLAELEAKLAELPALRERASLFDAQAHQVQFLRDRCEHLQSDLKRLQAAPARRNLGSSSRALARRLGRLLRAAERSPRANR